MPKIVILGSCKHEPYKILAVPNKIPNAWNTEKDKIAARNMRKKYPIVCLCGSTRFEKETKEMAESLTLAGQIVLMVNCWSRKDSLHEPQNDLDIEIKEMLDDLHKEKIRMSDYVLVINIGGYVGKSTQSEIDFATRIGKIVKFIEPDCVTSSENHIKTIKK